MQIFAIVLVALFVTIALFYCCLHCLSCDKYFTSKPRSSPDVEAAVRRVPATRSSEGAAQQNVDRSYLTSQGDHHRSYQFKHQVVQPPNVGKSTSILAPHYQVQPKPPPQLQPKEIHPQLNEAVKFKHIAPNCRSVQDAEQKSLERDSKYPQDVGEINTVFQVFRFNPNNLKSNKNSTDYWPYDQSYGRSIPKTLSLRRTRLMEEYWSRERKWRTGVAKRYRTLSMRWHDNSFFSFKTN